MTQIKLKNDVDYNEELLESPRHFMLKKIALKFSHHSYYRVVPIQQKRDVCGHKMWPNFHLEHAQLPL